MPFPKTGTRIALFSNPDVVLPELHITARIQYCKGFAVIILRNWIGLKTL